MKLIPLQPIPNQSFTSNIGGFRYDFAIKTIQPGVMAYDLSIDQAPVVQGFRIENGALLLPYIHMEKGGNFIFLIPDDQTADYQQFGSSQNLYYLSAEELSGLRNGN